MAIEQVNPELPTQEDEAAENRPTSIVLCAGCGSTAAFFGFTNKLTVRYCPECMPGLSDAERALFRGGW
jgi:hypothetical protein